MAWSKTIIKNDMTVKTETGSKKIYCKKQSTGFYLPSWIMNESIFHYSYYCNSEALHCEKIYSPIQSGHSRMERSQNKEHWSMMWEF